MSTIFVHIGQCGNQLSEHLWRNFMKGESVTRSHAYISHDGWHRAIHIDSEIKVIGHPYLTSKIREGNVLTGRKGCGTNWAIGYRGFKTSGGEHVFDACVESIRREVERCDFFSGFVLTHSIAGGTGSGLGSRLCEVLRDEYPLNYQLSILVAPCASGESPLQHFNSLLCLATLEKCVDGMLLFHNDDLISRAQKDVDKKSVSFASMNEVVASSVSGIFLPTDTLETSTHVSLGQEPWEMVRCVCPMPANKFIYSTHFARSILYANDNVKSFLNTQGPKDEASVTMAINSSRVADYLDTVCQRSKAMIQAGAYLHWYHKYGTTKEDFDDSLNTLRCCQEAYFDATKPPC